MSIHLLEVFTELAKVQNRPQGKVLIFPLTYSFLIVLFFSLKSPLPIVCH